MQIEHPDHPSPLSSSAAFLTVFLNCSPLAAFLGALPQVERLDDPSLVGKPLAVQQFNAGGFVAVR